jgi:hypothetical protein
MLASPVGAGWAAPAVARRFRSHGARHRSARSETPPASGCARARRGQRAAAVALAPLLRVALRDGPSPRTWHAFDRHGPIRMNRPCALPVERVERRPMQRLPLQRRGHRRPPARAARAAPRARERKGRPATNLERRTDRSRDPELTTLPAPIGPRSNVSMARTQRPNLAAMSDTDITRVERPQSASRGQKLTASSGGRKSGGKGGFWGVLGR